jgi:hypothetical protein
MGGQATSMQPLQQHMCVDAPVRAQRLGASGAHRTMKESRDAPEIAAVIQSRLFKPGNHVDHSGHDDVYVTGDMTTVLIQDRADYF